MVRSRDQNPRGRHSMKIEVSSLEKVEEFKYFWEQT